MAVFYKKSREKREKAKKESAKRLATGLAGGIVSVQSAWGTRMNNWTSNLSEKGKVMLLVGVVFSGILFGSYHVGMFFTDGRISAQRLEALERPVTIPGRKNGTAHLRELDLGQVDLFRQYLDSISSAGAGRDSLLRANTGLIDTVNWFVDLYR